MDEQLPAGQAFGRYQVVRPIGEGGMGVVYEAIHPALKRRFAIKTLHPTHASNEEARARFLREAEAASSIDHPNVVEVTDVGVEGKVPYMVMELLEGQTLDELFAERGPLSVEESVGLLLPVIGAAAAGHERGIIHRDLKPQNIFLSRGHRGEVIPKILDFGVSKVTGDENPLLTKTMAVLGTAAYMSPEQAQGAKMVAFQSDQYSLGLILFESLTGHRAYPGDSALEILHKAANGTVPPLRQLRPDLPAAMGAVLERMLALPIKSRYSSLREVGRALLAFASERTRLNLAAEFEPRTASEGAASRQGSEAPATTPPAAGDLSNPTSSGSPSISLDVGPSGTRVLAVSGDPRLTDTTLRHGAAEVSSVQLPAIARRRGRSSLAIAALVLVVGGAGALVVARRSGRIGPGQSSERSTGTRPAAESGTAIETRSEPKTAARAVAVAPPSEPAEAATSLFQVRATPPEAEIILDGKPPVRGRIALVLPLGGSSHLLRVSAPGFVSKVVPFTATERPPSEIRLTPIVSETVTPAVKPTGSGAPANSRSNRAGPGARQTGPATRVVRALSSRPMDARKENETPKPAEVSPQPRRGANNALMIPLN